MPVVKSRDAELEKVLEVARAMCVAARTAPKARGIDNIITLIIYGEDLNKLADEMEKNIRFWGFFARDAKNVRSSDAVVLIGMKGGITFKLDCGGCGFKTCKDFEEIPKTEGLAFKGPNCIYEILNLGIAIGSAVKVASENCVDNRVMYSVGVAAKKLGLIDAHIVIGIPLSARGKSIYFDRSR